MTEESRGREEEEKEWEEEKINKRARRRRINSHSFYKSYARGV
jgi:hypothetical protein